MNIEQADEFLKGHVGEGYAVYIANPFKRIFIRFDNRYFSRGLNNYIIKSEEQIVSLIDIKNKKMEIIKVNEGE